MKPKYRIKLAYVSCEGTLMFDVQEKHWFGWLDLNGHAMGINDAEKALNALINLEDRDCK